MQRDLQSLPSAVRLIRTIHTKKFSTTIKAHFNVRLLSTFAAPVFVLRSSNDMCIVRTAAFDDDDR